MSYNEFMPRVVRYLYHDQWRGGRLVWFSDHGQDTLDMLGRTEIMSHYNTLDRMVVIGPKRRSWNVVLYCCVQQTQILADTWCPIT